MGLAAVGVDEREDSVTFARQIGAQFPLLYDEGLRVSSAYGVAMQGRDLPVPAVFLILPDGTIFWRKVGESVSDRPSAAELSAAIDAAVLASKREPHQGSTSHAATSSNSSSGCPIDTE